MIYLTWFFMSFSSSAYSMTDSHLIEYLSQHINEADQAFQASSGELECKRFFMGFSASGSVGVSGVLDLEVSPEVTLIWEKSE